MNYAERFFFMALVSLAQANPSEAARICTPLCNGEFNSTLEDSFRNDEVQERIDELCDYSYDDKKIPRWYKNAVERINSRLGIVRNVEEEA